MSITIEGCLQLPKTTNNEERLRGTLAEALHQLREKRA